MGILVGTVEGPINITLGIGSLIHFISSRHFSPFPTPQLFEAPRFQS